MKKITLKLCVAIVGVFIAVTVLQNINGRGGVYAADQVVRSVPTICKSEKDVDKSIEPFIVKGKEKAEISYKQYEYIVRCEGKFEHTFSSKEDAQFFMNKGTFNAKFTKDLIHKKETEISIYDVKMTHIPFSKKYKVTGYMQSDNITTDFMGTESDLEGYQALALVKRNGSSICGLAADINMNSVRVNRIKVWWNVSNIPQQPTTDWSKYHQEMFNQNNCNEQTQENTYTYPNSSGGTSTTYTQNVTSLNQVAINPPSAAKYTYVYVSDAGRRLFIRHLYKSVQKREPAEQDYTNYLKRDVQTNAIDVIMSKEANEKNNINNMSNEQFVRLIYSAILCRYPDATGLKDYTVFLNNGIPRTAVIKEICESPEFRSLWNKQVNTLTFDANMCTAVHNYLSNQGGVHVIKSSNTTIKMFADGVNNVKELNISTKGLKNLNGLSQFPNLQTLTAMYNQYTDISEVSKLSNVKVLNLNNSNLSNVDISPIKSMKNLQELRLENNGLRNSKLKIDGISTLKKLYLNGNELTSVSDKIITNNLQEIYLDNNRISDASEVDYSNVKKISLKNNKCGINSSGTVKLLPQILDDVRNKSSKLYASGGLKFDKCKIVGHDVVMDSNAAVATITIKGGPADGTVITYKNLDIAQ